MVEVEEGQLASIKEKYSRIDHIFLGFLSKSGTLWPFF